MNKRVIIQYTLAGIIVLILGGLTGWYVFLRTQTNRTAAQDSARGFGSAAPVGNAGSGAGTSAGGTGNTYGGIGGSNSGSLSPAGRSEEHTSELQSQFHLLCRLLLLNN